VRVVRAVVGIVLVGLVAGAGGGAAAPPPPTRAQAAAGRPAPLTPTDLDDRAALLRHVVAQLEPSGRSLLRQDEVVVVIGVSGGPTTMAWAMPDVTADGREDVLQLDLTARRYRAREGRSGRVLWSLSSDELYLVAPARLGVRARPSLVGQSFERADGGVLRTGVVAIDGATGRRLWTHERSSLLVESEAGYAAADVVLVGGVLRGPGHQADRVVVERVSEVRTFAGTGAAIPFVIDGATGLPGDPGAPVLGEEAAWVHALPDLDGDRVEDFALTTSGTQHGQLSVRSGATQGVLWEKSVIGPEGGTWLWPVPLPGLGGPGRAGLALVKDGFDAATTTAFDGPTGRELWSVDRAVVDVLGRVDRDGVSDVLVRESSSGDDYAFGGLSGSSGRRLWTARITLDPASGGFRSFGIGPGGDLDGDGVRDVLAVMESGGRHPTARQVVVSGRTGSVRAFRTLFGQTLGAPLRGHREALVDLDVVDGRGRLSALDLGGTVWAVPLRSPGVQGLWLAAPLRLRPGVTDVLVSTYGDRGGDVLAVDGRTGAVRWRTHVPRAAA